MPVDLVLDNRHLKFVPGTVERAVITIAVHFWIAGAKMESVNEVAMYSAARLNASQWKLIRSYATAALDEILPRLAREHAATVAQKAAFREIVGRNGEKGRIVSMQRRMGIGAAASKMDAPSEASRIAVQGGVVADHLGIPRTPLKTPQRNPGAMAKVVRTKSILGEDVRLGDS